MFVRTLYATAVSPCNHRDCKRTKTIDVQVAVKDLVKTRIAV
jgi:hypothetical protein